MLEKKFIRLKGKKTTKASLLSSSRKIMLLIAPSDYASLNVYRLATRMLFYTSAIFVIYNHSDSVMVRIERTTAIVHTRRLIRNF